MIHELGHHASIRVNFLLNLLLRLLYRSQANNEISMEEFKFCVAKLTLGMTDAQVQALFSDIDIDHGGSIGLKEFELAILGRVGELG